MDNRFLFLGGDRRIIYAAAAIAARRKVAALGLSDKFATPEGKYGSIVLPLPFSREEGLINAPLSQSALPLSLITEFSAQGATVYAGGVSKELAQLCELHGLRLVDYYAQETLTLKNAKLTAEAACALLIQNTEYSLSGAEVIITGGGRIALMLARLLRCFGAQVTICARNAVQRAKAETEHHHAEDLAALPLLCAKADITVNTVPAVLFTEQDFRAMKAGAVFMELAGVKPSREAEYADRYGIRYIDAAGLPGKLSPKTAGEAIAEAILADNK